MAYKTIELKITEEYWYALVDVINNMPDAPKTDVLAEREVIAQQGLIKYIKDRVSPHLANIASQEKTLEVQESDDIQIIIE